MNKKDIYAIFARYLTKTTIDKDEENLKAWINESEENEALFGKLENHWHSPDHRKISILKSEEVKKEIWERANLTQSYSIGLNKKNSINAFLRYAAVFIFFIGFISAVYFQLDKDSSQQSTVLLISKFNNAGRKSTIHLRDGTIVYLNSESEISYHEIFSDTARIIWLTGEAFFDVAHDTTKPFYVYSHNLKVEALGTSFTVSGYPDNDVVQVSLLTGKVKVNKYDTLSREDISNEVELIPGQEISYQKNANIFSPVSTYDALEVEGWKDGILYFKHAGLEEIITKLNRWYGVEIQLNNPPPKEISYKGIFKKQNLENVLTSIGSVYSFDFRINDKNVMLNFKNEKYAKNKEVKKDR